MFVATMDSALQATKVDYIALLQRTPCPRPQVSRQCDKSLCKKACALPSYAMLQALKPWRLNWRALLIS